MMVLKHLHVDFSDEGCFSLISSREKLLETKKIIRSHDMAFCESTIIDSPLKDGQSGRIQQKGVVIDKPFKSPMIDVDDEDEGEKNDDRDAPPIQRTMK